MKNQFSGKRVIAIVLVGSMLLMPVAANAALADIITLITTITSTLENGIGTVLGGIKTLETTVSDFRQQVLFPINLINQARAFVGQVRGQFATLAGQIHAIENSSATLVNPKQFEALLRSSQSGNLAQLQPAFNKLYSTVPLPNDARPVERNLMDVDDAMAIGTLKTAVISDQTATQMLSVADGLEQQAAAAAPGSAPMLTAQARSPIFRARQCCSGCWRRSCGRRLRASHIRTPCESGAPKRTKICAITCNRFSADRREVRSCRSGKSSINLRSKSHLSGQEVDFHRHVAGGAGAGAVRSQRAVGA